MLTISELGKPLDNDGNRIEVGVRCNEVLLQNRVYERDHHGMECGCKTKCVRKVVVANQDAMHNRNEWQCNV